jgi:hypothetical protein
MKGLLELLRENLELSFERYCVMYTMTKFACVTVNRSNEIPVAIYLHVFRVPLFNGIIIAMSYDQAEGTGSGKYKMAPSKLLICI